MNIFLFVLRLFQLYKRVTKELNSKLEFDIEEEKKLILKKEACLKEIDEASKQAKESIKNLAEVQEYHLLCAKKLVRKIYI